MIKKIKFYKKKGKWHIDLPEWEGPKEDLEMVDGVYDLLTLISQGDEEIYAQLGDENFPGAYQMILVKSGSFEEGGAWYLVPTVGNLSINLRLRLPEVTKIIFGTFPETIWFYKSF